MLGLRRPTPPFREARHRHVRLGGRNRRRPGQPGAGRSVELPFTVLAREEAMMWGLSRAITLRGPGRRSGISPVLAHELGPLRGQRLPTSGSPGSQRHPLAPSFRRAGRGQPAMELAAGTVFPQLLVAYGDLGPAYGLTCVVLLFDPLDPYHGSDTHPPSDVRVQAITAGLGLSSAAAPTTSLVIGVWRRLVEAAEASRTDVDDAEERVAKVLDLAAHRTANRSHASGRLSGVAGRRGSLLTLRMAQEQAIALPRRADVLNAAWSARTRAADQFEVDDIERRALALL